MIIYKYKYSITVNLISLIHKFQYISVKNYPLYKIIEIL